MTDALLEKTDCLLELLRRYGSVAVAYSGGVDSALVARAAFAALGGRAIAVTAVSPSLATGELDSARQLAREIGIRHEVIRTDEFSQAGYQANAGDRCYYCKSELYSVLRQAAPRWNASVLCNGTNCDDLGDHRPGLTAADEAGVRSPLVEAGFSKAEVRELARHWNLPVWDKPASPCLSSRIAYGVSATPERVARIDRAERFLKETLQLRELRVRCEQNELARIEVPVDALPRCTEPEMAARIASQLRELGFRYVTLDLQGFRSGSLNAALPLVALSSLKTASANEKG